MKHEDEAIEDGASEEAVTAESAEGHVVEDIIEIDDALEAEDDALMAAEDEETSSESADDGSEELDELLASGEDDGMSEDSVEESSELDDFEPAEIEQKEFLDQDQVLSILESMLFATDKPQSIASMKQAFKNTNIRTKDIKEALELLAGEYANPRRGVTLEEVNGGYQLRTKIDNIDHLKQLIKVRPFKLSGPALEVLSIVAYKQPCIKSQVDELRGVESGHILRALMDKGLCAFAGKSDLPGKPMFYQTTRKFLEIFGLRNLQELPSLAEIDQLIPEGIGEEEQAKPKLGDLTEEMSETLTTSYSEGEEELEKITDKLGEINTSSEFFEEEKRRQKEKRERERAQDLREALEVGEELEAKDQRWLEKYEARLAEEAEAASLESSEDDIVATGDGPFDFEPVLDREGVEFKEPGEIGQELGAVEFVEDDNLASSAAEEPGDSSSSEESVASDLASLASESFQENFAEDESSDFDAGDVELKDVEVTDIEIQTYKPESD